MTLAATLRASLAAGMPAVLVRLAEAKGSTPREAGTVMAVTADAIYGTIGGGQFEWLAIDHARRLIADRPGDSRLDIPLGADIGQSWNTMGYALSLRANVGNLNLREDHKVQAVALIGGGPSVNLGRLALLQRGYLDL